MENTDTTDQAVETPEVDEKGPLAGFEEFSVEENETKDEIPKEVEAPDTSEEIAEAKKEEASEVETSEKPKEETKEETKEEPDFSFKAPEETNEETSEETAEASETWKNIGEDLDLDVQGEDFDDFKNAFAEKLKQAQDEAYNYGLEESAEGLENLDPQTKELLELSKNGVDLKSYLDPINTIDNYLTYDDKALVIEDLQNMTDGDERLYTDEEIADKIERLEERETLKDKADEIREGLIDEKESIAHEMYEESQQQKEEAYYQQEENLRAQSENFINTVKSTNEFMGGKIGDDIKDHVSNMWSKGKVHELFNDPKKIVDYVLYHTVGEQALEQRKNESFSNGQSKAKRSLHNIPPVTSAGASRGVGDTPTEEAGDFSIWESAMSEARKAE